MIDKQDIPVAIDNMGDGVNVHGNPWAWSRDEGNPRDAGGVRVHVGQDGVLSVSIDARANVSGGAVYLPPAAGPALRDAFARLWPVAVVPLAFDANARREQLVDDLDTLADRARRIDEAAAILLRGAAAVLRVDDLDLAPVPVAADDGEDVAEARREAVAALYMNGETALGDQIDAGPDTGD